MAPLARDELAGPRGEGYRNMIAMSAAGRAGTPDEVGAVGALLMSKWKPPKWRGGIHHCQHCSETNGSILRFSIAFALNRVRLNRFRLGLSEEQRCEVTERSSASR